MDGWVGDARQATTRIGQRPGDNSRRRATCNRQRATDNVQHATDKMQLTTCNGQRATCNKQHATDHRRQTATRPPETTENGRREKKSARSPQHKATNHANGSEGQHAEAFHVRSVSSAVGFHVSLPAGKTLQSVGRPNGWTSRTGSRTTSATAARNFSVKSLWSKDAIEAAQRRG